MTIYGNLLHDNPLALSFWIPAALAKYAERVYRYETKQWKGDI